jgi:predicted kinase
VSVSRAAELPLARAVLRHVGSAACQARVVRHVVVVSGAPGAGKSTLAGPLARVLGFPLLSKDVIKETLFDQLGHVEDDEVASSKKLGATAMELLWRLAAECPSVVIEANFRSHNSYERERLNVLSSRPVEVYCRVPIAVAAERYARRGASAAHHEVHVERSLPDASFEGFQSAFNLGPVLEVDTTRAVDVEALAAEVVRLLGH